MNYQRLYKQELLKNQGLQKTIQSLIEERDESTKQYAEQLTKHQVAYDQVNAQLADVRRQYDEYRQQKETLLKKTKKYNETLCDEINTLRTKIASINEIINNRE